MLQNSELLPALNVSYVGNNGTKQRLGMGLGVRGIQSGQGHYAYELRYVNSSLAGGHGNFHKPKLAFRAELESCEHRMLLKMVPG